LSLEAFIEEAIRRAIREEIAPLRELFAAAREVRPAAEVMRVEDIAEICGVEAPTVRSWIKAGKLKASKPGRHYLVRRGDFDAFMSQRDVSPAPRVDGGEQVRLLLARVGAKKGNGNG
jgi:excisionase family DNA binding protein